MRWLKLYEDYSKEKKDNPFYNIFPVVDREGWESEEAFLADEVLNDIKKFNDIFNLIGVWIKEEPLSMHNRLTTVSNRTLFKAVVNFDLCWNLNPSTEGGNLSNRIASDNPINIFYHIFTDDIFPMSKDGNALHKVEVRFNAYMDIASKLINDYEWKGRKFETPVYNVHSTNTNTVMETVITKLHDYVNNNMNYDVNLKGVGAIEYPLMKHIFMRAFVPNMTEEKLYKIVYEEISNLRGAYSHKIFNKLKDTPHYTYFRKIGGEDINNATDMDSMGFGD